MVNYTETDYKRAITHTEYRHGDEKVKVQGLSRVLPKRITHNTHIVKKHHANNPEEFPFANEKFITLPINPNVLPIWVGGTFLLLFLAYFIPIVFTHSDEEVTSFEIIFMVFFFIGFLLFAIYYFTMPKKELIYNREDGRVTFPGLMWHKNITMPIDKLLFSMSSPSMQGGGAYWLQIIRPDRTYSFYLTTTMRICYEDLSFYLWYMDKNRPLPPGEGFNPYREKDFERRKSERFPKPLFESDFETPEATEQQQRERKLIGGW